MMGYMIYVYNINTVYIIWYTTFIEITIQVSSNYYITLNKILYSVQ